MNDKVVYEEWVESGKKSTEKEITFELSYIRKKKKKIGIQQGE